MARVFDLGDKTQRLPNLPAFEALAGSPPREGKSGVVLQLLRQAAMASRQSKGRPFYSIRTVARHFSLPATTVTRLYDQLRTEGVLGSIWGSKTIIEPSQLDNDIRLKGIVALPIPLRAFSALSAPRFFVGRMQRALSRERFGSVVLFYDDHGYPGAGVQPSVDR